MILTLTFDLMTLILLEPLVPNDVFLYMYSGSDSTNSIWDIDQKRSLMTDKPFPLDTTSDDFNTDTAHKQ